MTVLEYAPDKRPRRRALNASALLQWAWGPVGLLAMLAGWGACVSYNRIAGTDLTGGETAGIVLGMHSGPLVAVLQGRSYSGFIARNVPLPLGLLVTVWLVTLLIRRPLTLGWRVAAWGAHLVAALMWYAAALLSLAYHLS